MNKRHQSQTAKIHGGDVGVWRAEIKADVTTGRGIKNGLNMDFPFANNIGSLTHNDMSGRIVLLGKREEMSLGGVRANELPIRCHKGEDRSKAHGNGVHRRPMGGGFCGKS